ncbi:MAG: glycosyltransferase [Parvularculaceae bacterium]|nr:glycosyltransferase [Parvularculaceae bacterium]
MRLLTVTTLYPNAGARAHGVFVENRLDAWRRRSGGEATVIAPIAWFPFRASVFGRYARYAAAPLRESRRGAEIFHPRYFLAPKIGMDYAPAAIARVVERQARALIAEGREFDLIDAHYLYPDGVAAVRAARALGKPVILTARGSDVTLLTRFPRQHAMILDAIFKADGVVAVARSLKEDLVAIGAPAEKIIVLRNGVDLDLFRPLDRAAIRDRMRLEGRVAAFVGGLIDRKGCDIAIRAIAKLENTVLLIAGEGPARKRLEALAKREGVADRVRFLGECAHEDLAEIYNAADALILPSEREGWPNVVLEAMACGAYVVAADAGGCREIIRSADAGRIVANREPDAFAAALNEAFENLDRARVRRYAEQFSWDDTSDALTAFYARIADERAAPTRSAPAIMRNTGKARLLFTIDTEETFDWSRFSADEYRVERPAAVRRLQSIAEQYALRPIYFLTHPIVTDAENAGFFRRLAEDARADLGIHLHQWTTPGGAGYAGEYYSWQCNLPQDAQVGKLNALSRAFEQSFGFRPLAHRAGRYGVDANAYRALAACGVRFDFSPSVAFDFSGRGGPDFSAMSNAPFHIETPEGRVFVAPVNGARAIKGGRRFLNQELSPAGFAEARRKPFLLPTAPLRLSCEGAGFDDLVALTRYLTGAGARILTFSLHSTTLTPGANAYAPDAQSVDAALALTGRYLEFFMKDYGGAPISLAELADLAASGN